MTDTPDDESTSRRNISIPWSLNEAMRKAPEVNWSMVATHAFRLALGMMPRPAETYSEANSIRWDGGE